MDYIEALEKALGKKVKKIYLPLQPGDVPETFADINDLLETVDFWIKNNIEVDPFICTPYVGSPIFYNNKDFVLEQYDERLKLSKDDLTIDQKIRKEWQLEALDKFMKECGDATLYTATVSKNFTIPDLIALKRFMYKHDTGRMIKMAHQRFCLLYTSPSPRD